MRSSIALVLCALASVPALAGELRVLAAASLTDALSEVGTAYEKATGTAVRFNFGASSVLARQIEELAPGDVFISADESKMDALQKRKLIDSDTRRSVLSNALVVIVPSDSALNIKAPRDLTSERVRRIALAGTEAVPAGIYARQYLERTGLWKAIEPKVVEAENVRGALVAVEGGNADAGIVYRTDAKISTKVRVACEISGPDAPAISYPAAVLTESKSPAEAKRFVGYLSSSEARAIFRRHGFIVR